MKLFVLVLLTFIFLCQTNGETSANCLQAIQNCDRNCPGVDQLIVKIEPKADVGHACNLIGSSPNNCCLMTQTGPANRDWLYQEWCCKNPPSPGPQQVTLNINGTSYIPGISFGSRKRSVSEESMFLFLALFVPILLFYR